MGRTRQAVLVLATVALALPMNVGPAVGGPIEDIVHDQQNCEPDPVNPTLSNYQLTGSGGVSGCRFFISFQVCLDHNGMIYGPSCASYDWPETSGTTNTVDCIPGVWATTVIINPPPAGNTVLAYIDRHSNPLIALKDCAKTLDS